MRKTIPANPTHMKQRIVTRFLLAPKTLRLPDSSFEQRRWFETTSWIEEWQSYYDSRDDEDPYISGRWRTVSWLDDEQPGKSLFFDKWSNE